MSHLLSIRIIKSAMHNFVSPGPKVAQWVVLNKVDLMVEQS